MEQLTFSHLPAIWLSVAEPAADDYAARPTLYLETTIPSYLTARRSKDFLIAKHQRITQSWWRLRRFYFHIHVSKYVLDEAAAGNSDAAQRRLYVLTSIPTLMPDDRISVLADRVMKECKLPERAATDARHIAMAAVHGMQYLLTWNCAHLANKHIAPKIEKLCALEGYACPTICTPEELMGRGEHEERSNR